MATFPGIYRAKAVALTGSRMTAYIPQVFGDTSVIIEDFVGTPAGTGMGWVVFHGGNPEMPVWLGTGATGASSGGGPGSATLTTRSALNASAAAGTLGVGEFYLVTDETPDHLVVTSSKSTYVNLATLSEYRPPAPVGSLRTITQENALQGYPENLWQINNIGDTGALGFATAMSVQAGDSIDFKVHSGSVAYSIDIIRLGHYGGDGARLIDTLINGGASQPNGTQMQTGEGGVGGRDCANWAVTDTWTVPADATHGVYLGVIKRTGRSTFAHIGPFVVNNTLGTTSDIVCMTSDMTWRAYNTMGTVNDPTGGKSLYGVGVGVFVQAGRCWEVSYDAPLVIGSVVLTNYWNGERPIHHFLEANGYNVSYVTNYDVDRNPALLRGHKVVMMCGHAEYISQNVRDAWDAALAAGAHAIVASGNTMLWRTRMAGRIMQCYKDSHSLDGTGSGLNNGPGGTWTGTYRDTRWADRRPECESIGMMFVANGVRNDAIAIPATMAAEPLWRDTSVTGLVAPATETLKSGCLGFEWDTFEPTYTNSMRYPPGLKFLSSIVIAMAAANEDGSIYTTSLTSNHRIVAYKTPAGKLVVNFGTNQWGWGLSDFHSGGGSGTNTTMKQATVNLLADMGCQPTTIDIECSVATNHLSSWVFPTMTSLALPDTAAVPKDDVITIPALAVWSNGITTDFATYVTWSSSNTAIATVEADGVIHGITQGTCTITGTYGSTTDTTALTVGPKVVPRDTWLPTTYNYAGAIFLEGAITLGTQFRSRGTGSVFMVGIRYWRSTVVQPQAPVGYVARVGGTVLATKVSTFGTPTTGGWEYMIFDTPLTITTTDPHMVWVWLPGGGYAALPGYFATVRLSRIGLFDSVAPAAGKFRQPTSATVPDTAQPTVSFGNNFYLVEPLITAEIVIPEPGDPTSLDIVPASLTMGVGNIQQLTGSVNWENIAPTNETAFTGWSSSAPSKATVTTGGVVTAVAVGNSTITGSYTHASGTYTDTCPVTVAPIAHAWAGADPTAQGDASALEIGTWFTVTSTTTIIGVRIWNPGLVSPAGGEPRIARLWSHNGTGGSSTVLRTVTLPALLPIGWSEYTFANFSALTTGFYCVSYPAHAPSSSLTASDFGAVINAFNSAITARVSFPVGAGHYSITPGNFPITLFSDTNPFYGVDVIYADV